MRHCGGYVNKDLLSNNKKLLFCVALLIKDVCTHTDGGHIKYKTNINCVSKVLNRHELPEYFGMELYSRDGA